MREIYKYNHSQNCYHMNKFLSGLLLMAALNSVQAQTIEFTVHHAPGGPSDRITRLLANELPVARYVVINRPGAAGRIAIRQLLSRPSLMVATMPQIFVTNPMIFTDLDYDPDTDLELIAVVAYMSNVLVCNSTLGFRVLDDLKNTTKSLNFGVAGIGSNEHLATAALLGQWINSHIVVPYAQGGNRSLIDLMGGNIDCMFANYPLVKSSLDDKSRITALITSHPISRLSIPTWQQVFGTAYPVTSQLGIVVSQHMDATVKKEIRLDIEKTFARPNMISGMVEIGLTPVLKIDPKSLADARTINSRLRDFITTSKVKLK